MPIPIHRQGVNPIIAPQGSEGPAPTFGEQIGAGFRTAKDDIGFVQDDRLYRAYQPIMDALRDKSNESSFKYRTIGSTAYSLVNPFAGPMDAYDVDAMWTDIQKYGIQTGAANREEFERKVLTRQGERVVDQRTLARGDSMVAPVIGAFGASVFDPVNVATAPIGGGAKTIGQAIVRGAILNSAVETVQQVPLASSRERMGEELTLAEAATNIGVAAAFGGFVDGTGKYIALKLEDMKPLERKLADALAKENIVNPTTMDKQIWSKVIGNLDDEGLADLAEVMVGRDNMSLDERAAVDVLRRETDIAASNPFIPDGAGIKAHQEGLAEAMERILRNMPNVPVSPRAAAPGAPLPRLRGSRSLSTGIVAGDARAILKKSIKVVESAGKLNARPIDPETGKRLSSALGPYQFLGKTWYNLYKARYGEGGLSYAAIIAKRTDPRLNEILMDDLMTINERSLQKAGHAADAGNMYLAHFAGPKGANKLLAADPNASARSVLGDRAVEANPFLENMTAADVVQWAHRKMTGPPSTRSTVSRETVDPEADVRARLDDELERIDAERARLDAEDAAEVTPIADLIEAEVTPSVRGPAEKFVLEDFDAPVRPLEPTARLPEAPPVEVLSIMPQLRAIVRSRETSLNDPAKLAKALGVNEGQLRQGLTALVLNREIRQNQKGQFMRFPRDTRPVDVLKFVARAGGIKDSEGHDLRGMFRVVQKRNRKVGKGALMEVRTHKVDTTYLVPGAGYVVSDKGRSVDDIGELLWEAGYINNGGDRPTEREVLEMLDSAFRGGKKFYPVGDDPMAAVPENIGNLWIDEFDRAYSQRAFEREAEDLGFALDDEAFEAAARLYYDGDYENIGAAIIAMVNREIEADMAAKYYELGDAFDEERAAKFIADARADGFILDEGFNGQSIDAGDTGAVGTPRGNAVGQFAQEGPTELNPEIYRAFDDPVEGAGAAAQIASMEHDLRASLDPAIAERQVQQAALKAASPMQAKVDQESTIGSPLFDAVDQYGFRLDAEGDVINPADLLAEIEADRQFFKTVKDCL